MGRRHPSIVCVCVCGASEFDAMCEDSVFLHRYEGESVMSYQSFRGMYGLDGREFYLIG